MAIIKKPKPIKKHGGQEIHMIDDAVDNIIQPVETQMSRRRLGDAPRPNYIWLVTFTDIMGLMLTFFVMMFAMAEPQKEQFAEITASLQNEMGRVYGARLSTGTEETVDLAKVNFNRALDTRYLEELIRRVIESHDDLKNIQIIPQPDSVVLSLPQDLLFEPGQATVKERGRKVLYTLGGALTRVRNRIEIDGHADPQPLEGQKSGFGNNWELSLARAANVAAILENVGYQQSVGIAGFASGRYQDLESVNDQIKRQDLSRRVDIIILNHSGKAEKVRSGPNILEGRP
jgi:chemotaxis protein MotB